MIVATGCVAYVLYHREFASKTLRALAEDDPAGPAVP